MYKNKRSVRSIHLRKQLVTWIRTRRPNNKVIWLIIRWSFSTHQKPYAVGTLYCKYYLLSLTDLNGYPHHNFMENLLFSPNSILIWSSEIQMSRVMRKPTFCICENKDADQLRGHREADQHLCFRYTDSINPLLSKSEISSL